MLNGSGGGTRTPDLTGMNRTLSPAELHRPTMAPQVGFEPTTDRLTADCSTTELLRNNAWQRPTLPGAVPQVPSALESLTSVFGMGTGVTSPLSSPGKK